MALNMTYNGVEVTYSEENSRFEFELRGKERYSESLAKAKEAIDKPVQGTAAKKFTPVRALFRAYNSVYPGSITSIAESEYLSQQVWFVKDENGLRRKESLDQMCEESASNLQLYKESKALNKEADSLRKKAEARRSSMIPIKITIPE